MKTNRTICLVALMLCILLSACTANPLPEADSLPPQEMHLAKYSELTASDGTVMIPTAAITREARFFNYDAGGVTVQLVALRDADNAVHIAFNTCQSCSPSPKAYYQQEGQVLKCTNCGFTFAAEEVGITQGGCNPWPIDGVEIGADAITIPITSLEQMRQTFTAWAGPTE